MTKSMSALHWRSTSRLSRVTELLTGSFHFEHQLECGLMLYGTLFVCVAQADPDEAHVEP